MQNLEITNKMCKQFKSSLLAVLAVACLFSSCLSSQKVEPGEHKAELDYTQEDVRKAEVERINKISMTKPVEALWRSVLLDDENEVELIANRVKEYLASSLNQKDYLELYYGYKSLVNCGYSKLAEEVISKNELDKLFFNQIPGAEITKRNAKIENMNTCISGTVTIWVDLGIKVQQGMGFANRVIGSGFFIDERGYIITNHHVIADVVDPKYEGYGKVYIKLYGDEDTRIPAKVIGWDSIHDLALLKTEITPPYVFSLGSSSDLKAGDKIYAIGSPLGLESTLTSGVVSSTNRKLFTTGSVLQIDAAVNSGNSGGPLIDENMRVQAIVFAGILQSQGLNFAIPVEYLKQELQQLYAGGEIKHAWISSYGRTANKGRKKVGLEVQYVIPGGSGCMAGLKDGDLIVEIAGQQISSLDEFQYIIMGYQPGTIIDCRYQDENKEIKTAYIYLELRSKEPGALVYQSDFVTGSFIPIFGMKLKHSSTSNRNLYIIEKVVRGGIADETSFSEGDEITVRDVKIDKENKYIAAQLYTKRKTKGYLDVPIILSNSLDSPFYF